VSVTPEEPDSGVRGAIEGVEALYTSNLEEHGIDSRAVGWPTQASQLLRFEKLAYLLEADDHAGDVTVNDWGCGYGAMFGFLESRLRNRFTRYYGYDISPEMLRAARGHVDDSRAELIESDRVTHDADYTFVSGTFNVRLDATEDTWGEYVRGVLREIAARSRRGFAFNLLTTYVDWRKDDLFYADPTEWFTFCRSELCRHVTLLHDYPLYEWTIVAMHEEPRR
jgi:SAM-dependent methyltransferase